jgi:hypothetical protein
MSSQRWLSSIGKWPSQAAADCVKANNFREARLLRCPSAMRRPEPVSPRGQPAVDDQLRAGDVARLL